MVCGERGGQYIPAIQAASAPPWWQVKRLGRHPSVLVTDGAFGVQLADQLSLSTPILLTHLVDPVWLVLGSSSISRHSSAAVVVVCAWKRASIGAS